MGKIAQEMSDRRLRSSSVKIRPATAIVSFQYLPKKTLPKKLPHAQRFYLRGMG